MHSHQKQFISEKKMKKSIPESRTAAIKRATRQYVHCLCGTYDTSSLKFFKDKFSNLKSYFSNKT